MSSLTGEQRRGKVFNTALEVRRQFIKLLVLTIWSSKSSGITRARDLVGLVNEQFGQANDAVQELTEIRKSLPNSRTRRLDLPSAVEVLSTGTLASVPHAIKVSVQMRPPRELVRLTPTCVLSKPSGSRSSGRMPRRWRS